MFSPLLSSSFSATLCHFILMVFSVPLLQWLEWHPCAPVLLAGTDDGSVWMWKIPSGDCKTFQSAGSQATTGKVLPDGQWVDNCFSASPSG